MRRLLPRLVILPPLLLGLSTWAGCTKDSNPLSDGNPPPDGYTVPGEAVAAWVDALEAKDLAAYTKMLEPDPPVRSEAGFRYYPQSTDVADFPWMEGDSWGLAEELGMIGHMMDSTFVGTNGNPVDTMSANLTVLSTQDVPGGILVQAHAVFQVLWSANSGAQSDVWLEILLVPDGEGYLHIRVMRELPLLARGGAPVEPSSWASIKALYR